MIDTRKFGEEEAKIVQYLQINKIIETPKRKSEEMEENLRRAELTYMTDLQTIIRETNRDKALIATVMGIETEDENIIPDEFYRVAKRLSTRWGIVFMDDRVVIPIGIREEVINALHFGHPGLTKMEQEAKIFWWPNMTEEIKDKQKMNSLPKRR